MDFRFLHKIQIMHCKCKQEGSELPVSRLQTSSITSTICCTKTQNSHFNLHGKFIPQMCRPVSWYVAVMARFATRKQDPVYFFCFELPNGCNHLGWIFFLCLAFKTHSCTLWVKVSPTDGYFWFLLLGHTTVLPPLTHTQT